MAAYHLVVAASAARILARLPGHAATAVAEFITGALAENPHRAGKPLLVELDGYHSARRGAYRVVYRIDDEEMRVIVVRIDHRSDVYRTR